MASLGHVAVGMVAARLFTRRAEGRPTVRAMLVGAGLSLLPDLDVVAFAAGIPYGAPLGHRGASHSIAFAVLLGVVAALIAPRLRLSRGGAALFTTAVVGSRGLLDAMTDGGKGIALFWPLSTERIFLPWRPLPVAPIGADLVSVRGLEVMLVELAIFAPLFVWALWPRRPPALPPSPV
ncbi:MAG: metal-dependent hydrolase [Polyangiaceae bacterium]